jgi:hypothetical protein
MVVLVVLLACVASIYISYIVLKQYTRTIDQRKQFLKYSLIFVPLSVLAYFATNHIITTDNNIQSSVLTTSEGKIYSIGNLVNTKWTFKIADSCTNYISFKEDTYEEYNCELDYPSTGKYSIKEDTLYLVEIDLKSNLGGKQETVKSRSKLILLENKLLYAAKDEFREGRWQTVKLKSSGNFAFTKVK